MISKFQLVSPNTGHSDTFLKKAGYLHIEDIWSIYMGLVTRLWPYRFLSVSKVFQGENRISWVWWICKTIMACQLRDDLSVVLIMESGQGVSFHKTSLSNVKSWEMHFIQSWFPGRLQSWLMEQHYEENFPIDGKS